MSLSLSWNWVMSPPTLLFFKTFPMNLVCLSQWILESACSYLSKKLAGTDWNYIETGDWRLSNSLPVCEHGTLCFRPNFFNQPVLQLLAYKSCTYLLPWSISFGVGWRCCSALSVFLQLFRSFLICLGNVNSFLYIDLTHILLNLSLNILWLFGCYYKWYLIFSISKIF